MLPGTQGTPTANNTTTAKMNAIFSAMRAYMVSNDALPCPADGRKPIGDPKYGVAAATGTDCSAGSPAANLSDSTNHVAIGTVPIKTLNLPNDFGVDAYGHRITYAVDTNLTASCWTSPATGKIIVSDNGTSVNAVATLVSHGADGYGAWVPLAGSSGTAVQLNSGSTDTDQKLNAHKDASFVTTASSRGTNSYSTTSTFVKKAPTSTFDDTVVYNSGLWVMNTAASGRVSISSITPPANGSYIAGQVLSFTVIFNKSVTVTGTPYLSLSALSGGSFTGTGHATYASGSGSNTLTFSYTVVTGDLAPSGLAVASTITLSGGTISSGGVSSCNNFTAPNLSGVIIPASTTVIFLTAGTANWTVPAGWDNANNTIEAIGPGGSGGSGASAHGGGGGGGGGAYVKITNYNTTAGSVIPVTIGAGGALTATQFKNATTLKADYGRNGLGGIAPSGGAGGLASNSYPVANAFSGGSGGGGGTNSSGGGGGGGGGAAGPNGAGANGGTASTSNGGGGGGAADGGAVGSAASTSAPYNGGNGGNSRTGALGGVGSAGSASANTPWGGTPAAGSGAGGGGGGANSAASGSTGTAGISGGSSRAEMVWDASHGVSGGGGGGGSATGTTSTSGQGGSANPGIGYGGGGGGSGRATSSQGIGGTAASGLIIITYR